MRVRRHVVLAALMAAVPAFGAAQRPAARLGWGGACGSTYEVDPRERLVLVFMIWPLPNRSTAPARFPMLVYQALTEAR